MAGEITLRELSQELRDKIENCQGSGSIEADMVVESNEKQFISAQEKLDLADLKTLNIKNGEAEGSIRTTGTKEESSTYKMGDFAFAEGLSTVAKGDYSHAEGEGTMANSGCSHAEGGYTEANGICSHAEGEETVASGRGAHTEGYATEAIGDYSHAEGEGTIAKGYYSHAEGYYTAANGPSSHAEGTETNASGHYSHAEGYATIASYSCAHAEGENTVASGSCSHAEGIETTAMGIYSHAEGSCSVASGSCSHAEGSDTAANGASSHAEGNSTIASGSCSHAEGYATTASTYCSHVMGRFNVLPTGSANSYTSTGGAFLIGNGSSGSAKSNAFRVTFDGKVYGLSAFNSSGADYAEYFEWLDGNQDNEERIGRFVTLDGDKIKLANDGDFVLGIISGNPSVIGNSVDDQWNGMYVRDKFGRLQYEEIEVETEYETIPAVTRTIIDENGNKTLVEVRPERTMCIREGGTEIRAMLNPNYDSNSVYIPRSQRQEWDIVGMLGQLVVIDDGSCEVNGYCKCGIDGVATKSENEGYRVLKRIDDNTILVIFR